MSNTSYWLYQRYVKYGNSEYVPVYPAEFSISGDSTDIQPLEIKSENDPNCGYHEAVYRWHQEDITEDYICSAGTKYYVEIYQVSYDGGFSWENVTPEQTRKGNVYETGSSDCIEYRWTNLDISTDWICDDCPELKLKATYSDSSEYSIECNSSTTLTQTEVTGHSTPCSAMTTAIVGDCVTNIGFNAFVQCYILSSITISSMVTSINDWAFAACSGLTNIDIPSGVTSIGNSAFNYCSSLTSIDIPDSVTSIGNYAFQNCSSLTSVTIGSGITSIGNEAFYSCRSLISVLLMQQRLHHWAVMHI